MINAKVKTPFGEGLAQGSFAVMSGSEQVVRGLIVRLPVNDVTRKQLNQLNCLTPRAQVSGLWVFQAGELK
jgi:hypothetical protein